MLGAPTPYKEILRDVKASLWIIGLVALIILMVVFTIYDLPQEKAVDEARGEVYGKERGL